MERITRRKSCVIGERSKRKRHDVVDVVLVRHALNAMPPVTAHVLDIRGPRISGALHDVVDSLLLPGIGSSSVASHGEPSLRAVDKGGGRTGVRHDHGEGSSQRETQESEECHGLKREREAHFENERAVEV